MDVLVFPTNLNDAVRAGTDWRAELFSFLDELLDKMEVGSPMEKLWDMTRMIVENKSELLGQLTLGFVKKNQCDLLDREYWDRPKCKKKLKSRRKHNREVETHVAEFALLRPYFYCVDCRLGCYPLDEALGLSASPKQYDVDDLAGWLASELP